MFSLDIKESASLDERYLEFAARTTSAFQRYPELEPLRHFIFKELLVKRTGDGRLERIKQWLRPLVRRDISKLSPELTDVLVVVESEREVIIDALLPVSQELTKRGLKVKVLSMDGPTELPCSSIRFRWRPSIRVPCWAKEAWQALCDIEATLREDRIMKFFYISCTGIQGILDECERALAVLNPRVVLLASTQLPGGASAVLAARARSSSSVLLQHGIPQAFYTPLTADYMLTWGESSNSILEGMNVPSRRLIALGSPRHDAMFPSINRGVKRAMLQKLSLPDRPTFVFFSNGNDLVRNGVAPLECAGWLQNAAAEYSDRLNIVVRLHPNEDGSLYRDCPSLHITKDALDLSTTLDACDWVGSLCSTVLYDALLYEKPVLQFYNDGWPELANNWRYGLAERISSDIELRDKVGRFLSQASRVVDKGASKRVFNNHGFAASAVADYVERLVKSVAVEKGRLPCMERASMKEGAEVNWGREYL